MAKRKLSEVDGNAAATTQRRSSRTRTLKFETFAGMADGKENKGYLVGPHGGVHFGKSKSKVKYNGYKGSGTHFGGRY